MRSSVFVCEREGGKYQNMPENRTKTGRFVAGKSGNPGGRPKMPEEMRQILREAGPGLARKLLQYTEHSNPKIAMWAITEALDRAYGKPTQAQDISVDMAGSVDLTTQIRRVLVERENERRGTSESDR